jgi:hypothetical protein
MLWSQPPAPGGSTILKMTRRAQQQHSTLAPQLFDGPPPPASEHVEHSIQGLAHAHKRSLWPPVTRCSMMWPNAITL